MTIEDAIGQISYIIEKYDMQRLTGLDVADFYALATAVAGLKAWKALGYEVEAIGREKMPDLIKQHLQQIEKGSTE